MHPPDAGADYDYIETINTIRAAIETDGHWTMFIPANSDLPYALKAARPDICFNVIVIRASIRGNIRRKGFVVLLDIGKDCHPPGTRRARVLTGRLF